MALFRAEHIDDNAWFATACIFNLYTHSRKKCIFSMMMSGLFHMRSNLPSENPYIAREVRDVGVREGYHVIVIPWIVRRYGEIIHEL